MHKGKLVFVQLKEHLPRSVFDRCVSRYAGSHAPLTFSHWDQLLCMVFAQLTSREGLRDITTCLRSQSTKLYHAGFRGSISRSTLADANERRDCRIFEDFALHLIGIARELYANDSLGLELKHSVYAIDASTIDLCLNLFAWAPSAKGRAGVKLHTLLDLRGNIPAFIRIHRRPRLGCELSGSLTPGGGQFLRDGPGLCALCPAHPIHPRRSVLRDPLHQ